MTQDTPTYAEIWQTRRNQCDALLWLVNRQLRDDGHRDLQDTERGRELVAMGVLYEVGPRDVAYQIVDDLTPVEA